MFFAVDLVAWHHAVEEVGAGLATVLGNLQVVLVAPIAWLLLNERLRGRTLVAIPISLGGVVLISGAVGSGAYGRNPGLGVFYGIVTALAYSGFLLTLRRGSADLRRVAGPLCDATLVAAVGSALLGVAFGELDLTPSLRAQGWLVLLALSSQALGWLVIVVSLPRLPAALASVLLTLQPVLSVLFAAAILGEAPSALQLVGVAGVLASLVIASSGRRAAARPRGRIGAESAQSAS
jgi:drug/metabolite transporter (DMT)-like permease